MIVAFTAILGYARRGTGIRFSLQSIEHGVHATDNELREKPIPEPTE
jgi:hypothetical protein